MQRAGAPAQRAAATAAADSGLVTLEWLLIVGVIAGLAASSALIVQRVLDDTAEVPADPAVRVLDADIAAAFVAREAEAAALSGLYTDAEFRPRCETDLHSVFGDVVDPAVWTPPVTIPPAPPDPALLFSRAGCAVTLKPDLGR